MGIFEPLFLLAVLGSVIVTMAALVFAVQGRGVRAFKIVRTYGICALAYLMAGVAMGFFKHQRLIGIGNRGVVTMGVDGGKRGANSRATRSVLSCRINVAWVSALFLLLRGQIWIE